MDPLEQHASAFRLPLLSGRFISTTDVTHQDASVAAVQFFSLVTSFGFAIIVSAWFRNQPSNGDVFVIGFMLTLCVISLVLLLGRPHPGQDDVPAQQQFLAIVQRLIKEELPLIGLFCFFVPGLILDVLHLTFYADCLDVICSECGAYMAFTSVTSFIYHIVRIPATGLLVAFCQAYYRRMISGSAVAARFCLWLMLSIVAIMWFDIFVDDFSHGSQNHSHDQGTEGCFYTLHNASSSNLTEQNSTSLLSSCFHKNGPNKIIEQLTPYFYPLHIEFALLSCEILMHIYAHSVKEEAVIAVENVVGDADADENAANDDIDDNNDDQADDDIALLPINADLEAGAQPRAACVSIKVFWAFLFSLLLNAVYTAQCLATIFSTTAAVHNSKIFRLIGIIYYFVPTVLMYRAMFRCYDFRPKDNSRLSVIEYIVISCTFFINIQMWMNMIADIAYYDTVDAWLALCGEFLDVVEIFVQTAFMLYACRVQSMRREATDVMRQTLLFLAIFNITQWISNSFLEAGSSNIQVFYHTASEYYPLDDWIFVTQLTQPFAIFYRFNSFFILIGAFLECSSITDDN